MFLRRSCCAVCFTTFLLMQAVIIDVLYAQSAAQGQLIFEKIKVCTSCHTIGGGKKIGPDLKGVMQRRQRDWIIRQILEPDRLIAEKNPLAMQLLAEYNNVPMPNQGLSTKEAQDILAYLENPDAASEAERQSLVEQQKQQSPLTLPAESDSLADIMKENAHKGRLLFTGKIMFAQNGPACIQCHAVANAGVLGGGTLGPDLTQAYTKFTGPGLASLLATTPYPTMQPIYSQKPLSPEEQQNLLAFFLQASAQKPRGRGGLVFAFIFIGFVVLGALSPTIWRRRLRDVRRPLAGR